VPDAVAAPSRLRPSHHPRAARDAHHLRNKLFSTYGFLDAFNPTFTAAGQQDVGTVDPTLGWFDVDYLGIDQGPISRWSRTTAAISCGG